MDISVALVLFIIWSSLVSLAAASITFDTFPPALEASLISVTALWTRGVFTLSPNISSAMAAETPHDTCIAIFWISGVRKPYSPPDEVFIAS